ncbi:hypothetical protein L3Y34_013391 [Caenorhabditis briggsae]|uniref:Uncharacterized protein n=1 Tax=Caenorhabditis briggsae TaxID=6238 RepID=A0AAE8ZWT2_CAEBR|nr:hypothetical protein L3Y34_013391 [Caenorhabditis briggsae]
MRRKRNPTMLKFRKLRKEQKLKMEQAFALSRKPDKATIASLPSERQLDKVRVRKYFHLHSHFPTKKPNRF